MLKLKLQYFGHLMRRADSLEKTLEITGIAKRSNQSVLKEINTEYSLEGLMLKQKLRYFWPPDAKSQLTGKDPDAGKD